MTQDDINHGGPIATICRRQCLAGDQPPELTRAIWRAFNKRELAIENMVDKQRQAQWKKFAKLSWRLWKCAD